MLTPHKTLKRYDRYDRQGVVKSVQAEGFYAKATQIKPLLLPAWQGLLELFDKSNPEKAVISLKHIVLSQLES